MYKHPNVEAESRTQTKDSMPSHPSFLEVVPELLKEYQHLTLVKEIEAAVLQEELSTLFRLLRQLPVEHLKRIRVIKHLINLLFVKKEYTLVSLLDKQLGQWGKSRYNGKTPAQLAASEKKWTEVLEIASHRENLKVNGGLGDALFAAAENGEWEVVKALITKHHVTHFSWHYPETGFFAIHFAIKANKLEIVQLFIENKMDVNSQSGNCMTPLHLAVVTPGCEKIVAYLLSKGANYNLKYKGNSLLDVDKPLNFNLVDLIVKYATFPLTRHQLNKILIKSVEYGQTSLVELLLEKYSNKISPSIKKEALNVASTNPDNTIYNLLWPYGCEDLEEKVESSPPLIPTPPSIALEKETEVVSFKLSKNRHAFKHGHPIGLTLEMNDNPIGLTV